MVKVYYVFQDNEKICNGGFFDMSDAIECAKETQSNEVEVAIWYNDDDFNNYEFADEFKTVWRGE